MAQDNCPQFRNKKTRQAGLFHQQSQNYFLRLLTESLNALPAENLTVLAAAILSGSPVFGLRPIRAARLPEAKVPKPISCTESPLVTALMICSIAENAAALP